MPVIRRGFARRLVTDVVAAMFVITRLSPRGASATRDLGMQTRSTSRDPSAAKRPRDDSPVWDDRCDRSAPSRPAFSAVKVHRVIRPILLVLLALLAATAY